MIKLFSHFILIFGLFISAFAAFAQDEGFHLTLTDEQNIGFDCPLASAVHPTNGELWVLMHNCFSGGYHLQAYDFISREPLAEKTITLDAIDGGVFGVERSANPLVFLDETTLEIVTYNLEDHRLSRFEVDTQTGAVTLNSESSDQLNTSLLTYTDDYTEFAVLSADRQYALAFNDEASYLINITNGELLKTIANPIMYAAYSADGQFVYLTTVEDLDNYENSNGVLEIYDLTTLPDGEALQTSIVPSVNVYPSPDGEYLALGLSGGRLGVISLASEAVTPLIETWEAPHQPLTCVNSGADLSNVDFATSGRLPLTSLQWLPDSSGFVTLNSYGGEGAGGGRPCYFNYSRLRHYQLNGG